MHQLELQSIGPPAARANDAQRSGRISNTKPAHTLEQHERNYHSREGLIEDTLRIFEGGDGD
jgi:hypothetical protein